ncbi:MAG: phenylalanine--tRNA ligase subunit beta [Gammaproteobacteria bacterium]
MKFSEKWLREWVDPPVSTAELVELLTMAGLEVDTVEPAAAGIDGLLVGEVVSVEPHPDADKLRVCRVNAGQTEALQIVCGAPNVKAGGRYPLAPVGARLPGIKIKKTRLRGVESLGMLCSARELGLGEDQSGLLELPADAQAGQTLADYLGLDDSMIDIDLTPNRGDCLGIEGIAREVGTLTRSPVSSIYIKAAAVTIKDRFDIEVQVPAACPRYLGRVIRAIDTTAVTPLWMQERLRRSGLRSLGPVVDVTNYVLLELGQPLHAFDLAKLARGIRVRYAEQGEQLTLLDERTITMNSDTLVIADHEKPLAIAGVMGGIDSGVQPETTDLFLECAFFTPAGIAGCARNYALHTDSAYRFERGVDPGLQERALERATALLLEICGGDAGPVTEITAAREIPERTPIELRAERIQRVLGVTPARDEVIDILQRLGMGIEEQSMGWRILPPTFRFDITLEADLIEEIGRIYGYNRIPMTPLRGALTIQPAAEAVVSIEQLSDILVARGYQEAVTYSFVDPELQRRVNPDLAPVVLANPISSEMAEMRTSLWPGLLKAVQYNQRRQKPRLRLFEHGLRFITDGTDIRQDTVVAGVVTGSRLPEHWEGAPAPVDFYDVRRDVEALLAQTRHAHEFVFTAAEHPALHPGQTARIHSGDIAAGWLGRIHPQLAEQYDIDRSACLFELEYAAINARTLARFHEISRYPSIRRDLAVVVAAEIRAGALDSVVREAAGELLQDVVIFDIYQGKGVETGRKSIAFGLILQDSSRTLTDQDVEAVVDRVSGRLGEEFGATLRD